MIWKRAILYIIFPLFYASPSSALPQQCSRFLGTTQLFTKTDEGLKNFLTQEDLAPRSFLISIEVADSLVAKMIRREFHNTGQFVFVTWSRAEVRIFFDHSPKAREVINRISTWRGIKTITLIDVYK